MIELARRRMMMGGNPLPYDAELEYLESTGTQYINTGITCNTDTDVLRVTFSISNFASFCGVAGCRVGASDHNFAIGYNENNAMSADCNNSNYANSRAQISDAVANTDYTIIISRQGRYIYKGDSLVASNTSTSDIFTTGDIYIFAVNGIQNYSQIKVKSAQVERSGEEYMTLIPVRKGNTGYLYDKVSGQLFGNQGTGDFIVGPDYNPFAYQYLTFIPVEDAVFSWAERAVSGHLEYSVNGGQTWVTIADGESTPTIAAGSKVIWRGDLRPTYSASDATIAGIGTFSASGNYHAYGNTMSLLFYNNYYDNQLEGNEFRCAFLRLFYNDDYILTAPELPATTLATHCYYQMFYGCTNLITAQKILPATTLTNYCYVQMYYACTSLTTAPELPATTLVMYSYNMMFRGCTNLSFVKCLATNISARSCKDNWLRSVSSQGTFVKAAGMENWATGPSGIPSGWTVVDDPSTITT